MEDRELIGRVEGLLDELESLADPAARAVALDTVQAVLELYGEGLTRIVSGLGESRATALAADELVEHLLLLHGLHPVSVEDRVRSALDGVRPYLGSHGGDVELIAVSDGIARVRMQGSCEGCPASAMTLKLAIEDAVLKAAPDVEGVEAEADGVAETASSASPLLQIELVAPAVSEAAWAPAGALPQLSGGGILLEEVAGERILFVRLADGTPYAYRPECPGCEGSLESGSLESEGLVGAELTCPSCRRRYDVVRAGRCLDAPDLHLEPVPLLVDEAGLIRIAVRAGAL
jgi:Fe-S cluster biogenesis protein NfuA/nitrite reductase/ring-hydroxylating ferredoxin subunit